MTLEMTLEEAGVDRRDADGRWVRSIVIPGLGQITTGLGRLHNNVTQRARIGGSFQSRWPVYAGTTIDPAFLDFQNFAGWAVAQKGWNLGWDLDKDLLAAPGSKEYGPTNCVFLPRSLNVAVKTLKAGAHHSKGRWTTSIKYKGQLWYLGGFSSEEEAVARYMEVKELLVKLLAETHQQNLDTRAFDALMNWECQFTEK